MSEFSKTDKDSVAARLDEVFTQLDPQDTKVLALMGRSWTETGQLGITARRHHADYARRSLADGSVTISRDVVTPSILGLKMSSYETITVEHFSLQAANLANQRWVLRPNGDIVSSNPLTNDAGKIITPDSPDYATATASVEGALTALSLAG